MRPGTTIVSIARSDEHGRETCRCAHPARPGRSLTRRGGGRMQVVHARCCGLDVHKKSVVACVLLTEPDGSVRRQVRTFGTMTADLLTLDDWLTSHGVTQVTM